MPRRLKMLPLCSAWVALYQLSSVTVLQKEDIAVGRAVALVEELKIDSFRHITKEIM